MIKNGIDLEDFRRFTASSRWRFAKTYVENYPHEYTLDEDGWCDEEAFRKAIACIERWGVVEPFWTARRKYLYVDEQKFWHMGDPASDDESEHPGLINRSWIDVARYRDQARSLGYDDSAIDRLVVRWQELLVRAALGKD